MPRCLDTGGFRATPGTVLKATDAPALYNACAAAQGCGVRLVDEQVPEPQPRQRRSPREDEMP